MAACTRDRPTLCRTLAVTIVPRPTGVLRALLKKPKRRSKTTDIPAKAELKRMTDASIPHARKEK